MSHRYSIYLIFLACFFLENCSTDQKSPLFSKLDPVHTGIDFNNIITTSDSVNAQTDSFIYNGAGVAAGDINNDGLPDLFFAGNMVSSRLYLNKGDMQFEDITESAGISTDRWATGVSMVDINNNGYLDIYISVSGPHWTNAAERANLLYINNGDNTFTEAAAKYQIGDTGFTTHAVFFDYNRNGYLDLFLLGNSPGEFGRGETGYRSFGRMSANPEGFDQLYRNNGDGTFTNVSEEAGILRKLGYGLGVAVDDLNGDGWPDIYVSNDITPNDVLYINNRDGTFTDRAADFLNHTSFAGMGIDIADFTNNGWPDIMQTDMIPEELSSRKRMSGSTTYSGYIDLRRRGYYPHYNINTLQMNQGVDENGKIIFSEIGRMAGVAYTNWSWSALFADYDNDGFKDLLVTNGYPKAVNDFDYLSDMNRASEDEKLKILEELHSYEVSNYIFRNNGDLTFTDKTEDWGINQPGFSYGAAYADLNNNGRLDLVINNINAPATVYQNVAPVDDASHYLMVRLEGTPPNTSGIGARVVVWDDGQQQIKYQNLYRGFMSSVDSRLHFGLGESPRVDSLRITWPLGESQLLRDIPANQMISLRQHDATGKHKTPARLTRPKNQPFEEVSGIVAHTDQSSGYVDYNVQTLLPYMVARQGPPLAAGDVNGDGLEDVFIGGAAGTAGKLFIQQEGGTFSESTQTQPWRADSDQEDWNALFFDANGNGLLDLYVASGGYHSSPVSLLLGDRLYINYGNGRFLKDTSALPQMLTSTGTVKAADFNGDGQTDLFVGGRLTPRNWPHPTRSYLLRNDGGQFTDVTREMAPELIEPGGMITDAVWIDFDDDGHPDLVTAGEWMGIRFYQNSGEAFEDVTANMELPPLRGWWNSLAAGDFNGDGQTDLAAGNLGLNHTYTASPDSPFGVLAVDMTGNRTTDIILTKDIDGVEYPFYGLARLGREIYTLEITYTSFESFANATREQVIGSGKLNEALRYQADTFASVVLLSDGKSGFTVRQLPNLAQISPIQDIIATDVNGDGYTDLITGGNLYESEPNAPRADAGNGLWLRGDGTGEFTPISPTQSGLVIPGDVRGISLIQTQSEPKLIITNNSDSTQVFKINNN